MTPPVALAYIAAGTGVIGAVNGTVASIGSADSGVHVSHCDVHYPKEFSTDQFAHAGQSVQRDVVKFHAEGGYWNNDLAVAMTGYVSNDNDALQGWPQSAHPNVPVNRFILLGFDKSSNSEDMSRGLLTVNIELWGGANSIAEGTPEDPWVALHVHGRFDPFGPGDAEYSFKLMVNSFGQIHLESPNITGTHIGPMQIDNMGDHVRVWLG
jgi:hypothetical protein